jgi:peroxiredoxin
MTSADAPSRQPGVAQPPAHSGSPRWARRWLIAAGIYNLLWGGAMILFPRQTLAMLGVAPQFDAVWPELWACIGMIVGVYGVGYLAAARDPVRHWPIVLVGLLGKVLGPIGFVDAALSGRLPWSMGATILTNDLIWWIPFAMMLWLTMRAAQDPGPRDAVTLDHALDTLRDDRGVSLRDLTNAQPALVVLLRHAGCTFCKEALADLARQRDAISRAGTNLVVVGMSPTAEGLRRAAASHGLTSATFIADPDRLAYRALELGRGTFMQLFGPVVFWRGFLATLRGHGVGKLEGDGFQMPGAFVIHRGRVVRAFRHAHAADRPDYTAMACELPAA